jgi:hypothetical protein
MRWLSTVRVARHCRIEACQRTTGIADAKASMCLWCEDGDRTISSRHPCRYPGATSSTRIDSTRRAWLRKGAYTVGRSIDQAWLSNDQWSSGQPLPPEATTGMPYQIVDAAQAQAIQTDTTRADPLFARIVTRDLPECPDEFVVRLGAKALVAYILLGQTLAELHAQLPL